jgi:hypothetical protein
VPIPKLRMAKFTFSSASPGPRLVRGLSVAHPIVRPFAERYRTIASVRLRSGAAQPTEKARELRWIEPNLICHRRTETVRSRRAFEKAEFDQ